MARTDALDADGWRARDADGECTVDGCTCAVGADVLGAGAAGGTVERVAAAAGFATSRAWPDESHDPSTAAAMTSKTTPTLFTRYRPR
jgi:hypothetical protein